MFNDSDDAKRMVKTSYNMERRFGGGEVCYVVSVQYSSYHEKSYEPDIYTFKYEVSAREFMRDAAKKLYFMMMDEHYTQEEGYGEEEGILNRGGTPPREDKEFISYWYEDENCISFGEDKCRGQAYDSSWGTVVLHKSRVG